MSDISKAELKKEIQAILKDADLDNTSAKKVRLELQEKLDADLTERKKEVDQLVMEVIDEQTQEEDDGEDEEEEDEEDEDEEEEEEVKKPVKRPAPKPQPKAKYDSESEEEEASDGGGSDYEPDEPVRPNKVAKRSVGAAKKKRYGSDDDESSGEEWGKSKKKSSPKKRAKKGSDSDSDYAAPKRKKKAGGGGGKNGWTAPLKLSEELADVVGGDFMPRHEVVKKMWAYIKENNLQDPKNKQFVKCDDKLSKVFPTKKFRGFGMTKFLKEHMNVD